MTRKFLDDYRRNRLTLQTLKEAYACLLARAYPQDRREPGGGGQPSDRTGRLGVELALLRDEMRLLEQEIAGMQGELDRFLDSIQDPVLAVAASLYYRHLYRWNDVAEYTNNTEQSIKMMWYRYRDTHVESDGEPESSDEGE